VLGRWRSLVAGLALVAFLVANGPVFPHASGLASRCACSLALANTAQADTAGIPTRPTCNHCRSKLASQPASPSSASSGRLEDAGCPSGPCSDGGSEQGSCPCPGGCASCSVAKVPCSLPSVPSPTPVACLGPNQGEGPPLYSPPSFVGLTPPPKA